MVEKPNPNRKTTVEDADISSSSITTRVVLRENAVPEVRLQANNEAGANYLKTLHLKDEIVVKMIDDSNPPTAINWVTDPNVVRVFDGNVEELSPLLNTNGQVVEVIGFGKGYGCGQMRVADTYRNYTPYPSFLYQNAYVNPKTHGNWAAWVVTSIGFLRTDDTTAQTVEWMDSTYATQGLYHYISVPVLTANIGSTFTAFTASNLGQGFEGASLTQAELHIVGGLTFGNHSNTTAILKVGYSIDSGVSWHTFTAGAVFSQFTNASHFGQFGIPLGGKYNPATDTTPPQGEDHYINMLTNLPTYHNNIQFRFSLYSVGGDENGEVGIIMMYLKYLFVASDGNTVRQLIAGPTNKATAGIVSDFINTVYPLGIPSGYTINTDYVYKEPVDTAHQIPYIKFPYQDGLTALQDIIKQGSALQFNQGGVGYHFIFDVDGNLLLAPVTNHHVSGVDPTKYIDTDGGWALTPYLTPIKVREDMIVQRFTQQMPLANYVQIAGRFLSPFDDLWCEQASTINTNTPSWRVYKNGDWSTDLSASKLVFVSSEAAGGFRVGGGSLEFTCDANSSIDAIIGLKDYPTDFTKLMGDLTTPEVHLFCKLGGNINSGTLELRLYQDKDNYFGIPISTNLVSAWTDELVYKIPNIIWNPSEIGKWKKVGNPSLTTIYFIGIYYAASLLALANFWLDGLHIEANIVRAATDSTSISGPITIGTKTYTNGLGCRTLTIKDSVANTDRIDDDPLVLPTTPLALECFYELSRHRIARMTGQIKIPLNPHWLAGQICWIQAECNIPKGSVVTHFASIPTTSTSGNVGDYWVSTGTNEVYLLTSITHGPTQYHWTDQLVKEYSINDPFRITEVMHEFTEDMAATTLMLTNDFINSCPIDTKGSYSVLMRTVIPDFQNRTMGSLKSGGDFNLGLTPIVRDYPS